MKNNMMITTYSIGNTNELGLQGRGRRIAVVSDCKKTHDTCALCHRPSYCALFSTSQFIRPHVPYYW